MKLVDFLIVGGSAAGTTAAEVIRGLLPDVSISIVTDESHEQYSRVLLPHFIRHKVEREQVFLKKAQWYADKRIDLVKGVRAQRLEVSRKTIILENGEEIQYGKLLISIGGYAIKLDAVGADLENILYLRTLEDADRIVKVASSACAKALADKQSAKGVIVGGGFIGLEFCSCFAKNGVGDICVLVMEPYFWKGKLDEDSSKVLVSTLEKNGIKVLVGEQVDHFVGEGKVQSVVTKSGGSFEADVVGIGIGIKSDFSWLEGTGIEISRAIVTNEYLETNLPDVYAAGDCAEFRDVIFDRQHIMGNWANATSQGSAVGKTMSGQKTVFETASSYSVNFFDPPNNGSCTFIGVTDEKFADEIIKRGSVDAGKMTRIFVKTIDGVMRVVGATIINNPMEVAPLTAVIKGKVDIFKNKDKFVDASFDLKELLV